MNLKLQINNLNLPIKGFQKTSTVDYPERISSIIFLGGCNFRCHYCYNKELIFNQSLPTTPIDDIISKLLSRKKYIDSVVISGGEPTIYHNLPILFKELKNLGFKIKLDTNGTNPPMLRELISNKLVDYIAMDIKASQSNYNKLVGRNININLVNESVNLLLDSNIDFEFRTTLVKEDHPTPEIIEMASWIKGAKRYCLQQFKNNIDLLNNTYKNKTSYTKTEAEIIMEKIKHNFKEVILRFD